MLLPLPSYSAFAVAKRVAYAHVNDAGLVAGVREVGEAKSTLMTEGRPYATADPRSEAFVWREGKVVFHDPAYTSVAGPNAKGQVAFGGKSGLFLWQAGRITRCVETPIGRIAGIADDGSVIATLSDRILEGAPFAIVWPSNRNAEGSYRFGPVVPRDVGPMDAPGADDYESDGSGRFVQGPRTAGQRDGGTAIRTPNGVWWFPTGDPLTPTILSSHGFAVVVRGSQAFLWHHGDLSRLDVHSSKGSSFGSPRLHAVNGKGEVVGAVDGQALLWQSEEPIDLSEAAGGPTLDDGIAISDCGNVLARSGSVLYLLRRRG